MISQLAGVKKIWGGALRLSFKDEQFVLTEKNNKGGFISTQLSLADAATHAGNAYVSRQAALVLDRLIVKRYKAPLKKSFPSFLDSHQVDGVDWILTRSRSYLAHAPGAGKTCQAFVAGALSGGAGPCVFIVPPSLTRSWVREIDKFFGAVNPPNAWPSIYVVSDSSRQQFTGFKANIIIVPDSMLTKHWVLDTLKSLPVKFLAVDEASRFKDPKAQRSLALFGGRLKCGCLSTGLVYNPRHSVLMDGSPMPNRAMELWGPTFAMSPQSIDFMDSEEFGFLFGGATMNDFGRWEFKHSSREDILKQKLTKDFMHIVTEDRLNHPERKRSMHFLTEDVRSTQMKKWEKRNLAKIDLSMLTDDTSGGIAAYRRELGLKKTPGILQYVTERLTNKSKESILLFAWHKEVCEKLIVGLKEFKRGLIYGDTPNYIREKYVREFQEGTIQVLVMNIAVAGRGYNLQKADRVIFGEFSWSDETNKQAEKRASRKGNTKAYTRCEYIVAPNSIDEVILSSVFRKAERVKKVIG